VSEQAKGRRIFATQSLDMRPYDMDGPLQPEMSYARLSHGADSERGSYLMRMRPGAATIPHERTCREEFLILEGEAIEEDGTVLKPGDWIVYEPGTRHSTRTVTGCLLLGLDWDPPGRR
jgi:mannose-6-phosphate isomerase-like protein (cupin superfamily)